MIELVQRSKYDAFMHSQASTCSRAPGLSLENWMPVTLTKGAKGLQVEHLAEKLCQLYWIHSADGSTVPWRRPLPT
jgi:hypothetical protein